MGDRAERLTIVILTILSQNSAQRDSRSLKCVDRLNCASVRSIEWPDWADAGTPVPQRYPGRRSEIFL